MVDAGVAVVDAHGAGSGPRAGAALMLPLFEGFLDAGRRQGMGVEEEHAYDLVGRGSARQSS